MRTSMLSCVAAIGLFACRSEQFPQSRQIDGAQSQTTEGSTDGGVFDVNCTDRPSQENTSDDNTYACAHRDEQIYDIDRKYADYAWAVFAGISKIAPEQAPELARDSTWIDWRTWGRSDVPMAETCHLGPRRTDNSMPPNPNPLVDGNGNRIRYEVRYHSEEPEENEKAQRMLASVKERLQVICSDEGTVVTSWGRNPSSDDGARKRPAIRLKLAWKKLSEAERRAAEEGKFIIDNPAQPEEGLVAIHLAIKSATSDDWWTWATFSHVGNLTNFEGLGPFFESCEAGEQCNTCPEPGRPTPIRRVYPPSPQVVEVNEEHRKSLQKSDPLWWYELVGVQRTENARYAMPFSRDSSYPPPMYRPTFLASEIIEWDYQAEASCIGCHDKTKMWYPEPGTREARDALCDACEGIWDEGRVAEVPGTGKYVINCAGHEFSIDRFDVRDEDTGFSEMDMFALPGSVPPLPSPDRDVSKQSP